MLLYVYLLVSAFSGGYLLARTLDEVDEEFPRPPFLMVTLLCLISPVVIAIHIAMEVVGRIRDRIGR